MGNPGWNWSEFLKYFKKVLPPRLSVYTLSSQADCEHHRRRRLSLPSRIMLHSTLWAKPLIPGGTGTRVRLRRATLCTLRSGRCTIAFWRPCRLLGSRTTPNRCVSVVQVQAPGYPLAVSFLEADTGVGLQDGGNKVGVSTIFTAIDTRTVTRSYSANVRAATRSCGSVLGWLIHRCRHTLRRMQTERICLF